MSLLPPGMSLRQAIAYNNRVGALIQKMIPGLVAPHGCCKDYLLVVKSVNGHYQPVPPATAARRIAGIFGDTQTVGGGSGNSGNSREPLGELVQTNVELIGLQGQPVFLRWWISQEGSRTHAHLFGKWFSSDFVGYSLVATTENDTGVVSMWIPLPKVPGPYILHLDLTTDGNDLISANSPAFG
jgi:hypothetical protein